MTSLSRTVGGDDDDDDDIDIDVIAPRDDCCKFW